jgi:hypothetical protein
MRLVRAAGVVVLATAMSIATWSATAVALEAPAPLPPAFMPLVERFVEAATAVAPVQPLADPATAEVTVTFTVAAPQPPTTQLPIYRFYNPGSGTHFYTPSAEERDMVMRRWPTIWRYEGIAYYVNPAKNSQPLYRFYNYRSVSHFYTASTAERDTVIARWSNVFRYEGPTYNVSTAPAPGKLPVYRFYNLRNGSHFYTASSAERDTVIRTWPHIYKYEGPVFWLGQ